MKISLSLLFVVAFSNIILAQTTAIPDSVFEASLISQGYDTGPVDGSVPTAAIDTVTSLNEGHPWIKSLIGIEDFAALTSLQCQNVPLKSLNLSQNKALAYLDCRGNKLTSLDLSQNVALKDLICHGNQLNCLNLKNGNNTIMRGVQISNNPDLKCIEVDDVAYSTANWTNVDAGASYSTSCPNKCVIQTSVFSYFESSQLYTVYPNPTKGRVTIKQVNNNTLLRATVRNNLGQEVSSQNFESSEEIALDINAPAGIYFLTIETVSGESKTIKVVRE